MQDNQPEPGSRRYAIWPQVRRLLILQFKLYIDAFRDLCLSALTLGAFIIDLIQRNEGADCYFDQIMKLGRRTERAINLFDQYDPTMQEAHSVDSVIRGVEERFRR